MEGFPMMRKSTNLVSGMLWLFFLPVISLGDELPGVTVRVVSDGGQARVSATLVDKHKIRLKVDPHGETKPIELQVELANTGPNAWPIADVIVCDAVGNALLVRHPGTEWHKMSFQIPPVNAAYYVQVTAPHYPPLVFPETERALRDDHTGIVLAITRWYDGRRAALSLRFDDSHPTHLNTVIPMLNEYGFAGTFMVNPGARDFQERSAEWTRIAQEGRHELANHTLHHRGAIGDDEMEIEVGDAAKAIRNMTSRATLMALNLGGGTYWQTTRSLRFYLDKYCLFDASAGSLGMDDTYGNRLAAFSAHLANHIARGLWCRIHFHSIGKGLASSEETLRNALDLIKKHEPELWVAGMTAIYKYETERNASRLRLQQAKASSLVFEYVCETDSQVFEHPLTIAITSPQLGQGNLRVFTRQGTEIPLRPRMMDGNTVLCFDVQPPSGQYIIEIR